jgi:hypothetical protein
MRCFLLMIGLLCSIALPSWAQDKKQPVKAPADYFKVEIRGTLRVVKGRQELVSTQGLEFNATILGTGLIFGDNKDLAALAKKLDGKTVLISGDLRTWSQLTAGPPSHYVHYVQVTALKTAE